MPAQHVSASIYGLFDSGGRLRYIGKANNPQARLKGHMREIRRRTPLYDWLRKNGMPEMRILEADCPDWREAEKRLIYQARVNGESLLNLADGGDEPFCSSATRSANGTALNVQLSSNPSLRKLRDAKRVLGFALSIGAVRNSTRAKMREMARLNPRMFGAWATIVDREEIADE